MIPAILLSVLMVQGGAGEPTGFPGTGLGRSPRVEIPWNRYYDADEIHAHFDRLIEAFPELASYEVIGHSTLGRELRVFTLNDPATGPAGDKPAMWIDGNVHGNEIQGAEAVLYTAWYLLENHGHLDRVTELLGGSAFYLLPMVNPDGRAAWFAEAHNAHSSRTGLQPIDDDGDGRFDEDPPDDMDGDGHIVSMRKYAPGEGTHRVSADDPRVMERVPPNDKGIRGDWLLLGSEGIDDDGDGRINEDGLGGYDMNRAWPSLWQPGHVQYGAGPYPLYWPETRAIAEFLFAHPNVAGVQSFHNAGGMILRGPGAKDFGSYPRGDVRVFDELGRDGERMLPFYRYMVIWEDLYTVFGGFATWTYEGLGIISFTNELWARKQQYPDPSDDRSGGGAHFFDDTLLMGGGFIDWHPVEHPTYGEVELGGFRKDVGRVAPSFLVEEMLHRNALFTLKHAAAMPRVTVASLEVTDLGAGLLAVDATFRNEHLIPTRTARAAEQAIGLPDTFFIEPAAADDELEVLAGGLRRDRFRPEEVELAERDPARLVSEAGIGGRAEVRVRWYVSGSGNARAGWRGQKALDVSDTVPLAP